MKHKGLLLLLVVVIVLLTLNFVKAQEINNKEFHILDESAYINSTWKNPSETNPTWIVLQTGSKGEFIACWRAFRLKNEGNLLRFDDYASNTIMLSGNFTIVSTTNHLGYNIERAGQVMRLSNPQNCR